ncbi:hypothetical protein [uncultured Bradyrhizobium sp.]|uniref:hypothetical protein n=1 Tax=uncultured Bradyrhizobium sp. TaxID=199684 RepID=UPI0035CBF499
MFTALYLISALLVGLLAIGQRGGFVIYFVLAVGVSPILALLILILASPRALNRSRYDYYDDYPDDFYPPRRRRSC